MRIGTNPEWHAGRYKPDEQENDRTGDDKGQQNRNDELLGSLDEAFMLSRLFDVLFRGIHIECEFLSGGQWPVLHGVHGGTRLPADVNRVTGGARIRDYTWVEYRATILGPVSARSSMDRIRGSEALETGS